MKFYRGNKGRVQRLVALALCVGMLTSLGVPVVAAPANSKFDQDRFNSNNKIVSATATTTAAGVRLEWRGNLDPDNLGFNIYRVAADARTRLNQNIIPGAVFVANARTQPTALRSYSWIDRDGRADSVYYIEWVSVSGASQFTSQAVTAKQNKAAQTESLNQSPPPMSSYVPTQKSFPTVEQNIGPTPNGVIETQWDVASRPALKITIKSDGWYRVTQPEMVSAGFNPVVDIRKLRLFNNGQELAINTSQALGPFGSSDFIEFYGQGLETPTTDSRTYYLIADTVPGKRVGGAIHLDGEPAGPLPPAAIPPAPGSTRSPWFGLLWSVLDLPQSTMSVAAPVRTVSESKPALLEPKLRQREITVDALRETDNANHLAVKTEERPPDIAIAKTASESAVVTSKNPDPVAVKSNQPAISAAAKPLASKKANPKKLKRRKQRSRHYNHAEVTSSVAPQSFDSTVELKERVIYFPTPLNGDTENFFGRVLNTTPVDQTLNTPNPAVTGVAKLEVAFQGVSFASHQVDILINNTAVGSVAFFGQDHVVQSFDVPVSQLQNGANTVTISPVAGGFVSLIDYVRITYPHAFRADANSLKFNLRGTQSLEVDGFSVPNVRLIDYTDPFSVSLATAAPRASSLGYAVTVPPSSPRKKDQRLLYAIVAGQFRQAASLSLNQPSTLNTGNLSQTVTGGADFLIIAHKSLISALGPLVTARQNQGFTVGVVDVEDVYDEFSYGVHGPQAIKAFLAHAATHWTTAPRYLIFAGDATYDPRNYTGNGDFDMVPTKLVDATFSEAASDDWLADFDDDGIANIPVGRLPVRTAPDASLVVSKIVNFTPVTPEAALLVADDPGTPPDWDFETASDDVQAILPATMTVQRVNVRTEPSIPAATTDIINGFTAGRSVVNYSGHGNIDVWSGSAVFTSGNATALANTKLPFVIVMDCLNGYFHEPSPNILSLSEAFLLSPNGGAVAAFASSGFTSTPGQRQMELELYRQLYGSQPISVGDAIKIAKNATFDIDVKRTWIYFGDPSLKIR